jgi:class 3 adenylate cyclase
VAANGLIEINSNDLHMDYSAIGETTHLAARMEQLAPPGTIRLTATTLRLVEGLIRVTPLGPVPICIKVSYLPYNHDFRLRERSPYSTHSP